jgi:ABC-type oligopeptide transport system ATPase subunit
MSGIRHLVVGFSGCGKTTYTKELLKRKPKNMPLVIYDINQEYQKEYPEPFIDFEQFLQNVVELRNTYMIFEEATIFFDSHNTADEMKDLLVRARHTGNIIQLNFHSFSSIPKYIKNLIDYITIFNTGDTEKDVTDKFGKGKIYEGFLEVRSHKQDKEFLKGASNVSIYRKTIFVYGGA